ncbi:MAG: methylated-DNA--[protein]-cysteine S-methyltransferase [Saccharofermentanales bacterium]
MAYRILSYPKLRRASVVSGFLGIEEMKSFKALLDRSKLDRNSRSAYMLHDEKSFVLLIINGMPHNGSQVIVDTYIPSDFSVVSETDYSASDDSTDTGLWESAVSFLSYELFFIRKLQKAIFYTSSNRSRLQSVLKQYRYTMDGLMKEHFLYNGKYFDAEIHSLTSDEFDRYSTGIIPILDEYLVVRTTNAAVFAIDVIKRDEQIPYYLERLIGQNASAERTRPAAGETGIFHDIDCYSYTVKCLLEISEYLAGDRKKFDLEIEIYEATDFQKTVWSATVKVPYGQTFSYEDISRKISGAKHKDNPNILSRAVGTALSRNPVMIVIPCHRVIGKDGKLRGFAGGLDIKDFLLTHELTHYK